MDLEELQEHWNQFGKIDPLYAILTAEGKQGKAWDLEEFFASGTREVDEVMSHLESLGLRVKRGRALDFGCGIGRLTQALTHYFDEVCGVDIAPSMINLANEHNRDLSRCRYYLNSRADLEIFENDSFDFIYSNITLQHMAPRYSESYIREFLRVLSTGGLLVFQLLIRKTSAAPNPRRSVAKDSIPAPILALYRKCRYGGLKPVMQIYGLEREVVVKVFEENNSAVLDLQQADAEDGLVSCRYVVTKRQVHNQPIDSEDINGGSSLNYL